MEILLNNIFILKDVFNNLMKQFTQPNMMLKPILNNELVNLFFIVHSIKIA